MQKFIFEVLGTWTNRIIFSALVLWFFYRSFKHYIRPCKGCGAWVRVWRYYRMLPADQGCFETNVYAHCYACGETYRVGLNDKRKFSRLEFFWRKYFKPWQFQLPEPEEDIRY